MGTSSRSSGMRGAVPTPGGGKPLPLGEVIAAAINTVLTPAASPGGVSSQRAPAGGSSPPHGTARALHASPEFGELLGQLASAMQVMNSVLETLTAAQAAAPPEAPVPQRPPRAGGPGTARTPLSPANGLAVPAWGSPPAQRPAPAGVTLPAAGEEVAPARPPAMPMTSPAGAVPLPDDGGVVQGRPSAETPDAERKLSAPPTADKGAVPAPPSSPISEPDPPAWAESRSPFPAPAGMGLPFLLLPGPSLVRLEAMVSLATTSPARGDLLACLNGPLPSVYPAPSSPPASADSSDGFAFVWKGGATRAGLIPMMGNGEGDAGAGVANPNPISQQDWKKRKKRSK